MLRPPIAGRLVKEPECSPPQPPTSPGDSRPPQPLLALQAVNVYQLGFDS